jgi:hypothetical protein
VKTLLALVLAIATPLLAKTQDSTTRSYDRFTDTSMVASSTHLSLKPIESVIGLPPRADTVYLNLGATYKGQKVKASRFTPFIAFSFHSKVRDTTLKRFDDARTIEFLIDGSKRFSAKREFYSAVPIPLLGGLIEMARYTLTPDQLRTLAKARKVEARIGTITEVADTDTLSALAAKVLRELSS